MYLPTLTYLADSEREILNIRLCSCFIPRRRCVCVLCVLCDAISFIVCPIGST